MKKQSSGERIRKRDLLLGLIFIISVIIAWIAGAVLVQKNVEEYLGKAMPAASEFVLGSNDIYSAYGDGETGRELLGYVTVGEGYGYGGPLRLAVAVDLYGDIAGYAVIDQKETLSYYGKVAGRGFFSKFNGRNVLSPLILNSNIDAVTGATTTSSALVDAMNQAGRKIAIESLALEMPPAEPIELRFTEKEAILLLLFAGGIAVVGMSFRFKKVLRWVTMISSVIFLGFIYNSSITISKFSSYLMGYFPDWRTDLFWIILIGGLILATLLMNRNPYCHGFCPFGSAQECIGAIGNAKAVSDQKLRKLGLWTKRGLAWGVILLALIFRNSSIAGYEVFAGLFALTATTFQFIILITILVASLFIKRPWCTFLCPIDPVVDFFKSSRQVVLALWKRKDKQVKNASG